MPERDDGQSKSNWKSPRDENGALLTEVHPLIDEDEEEEVLPVWKSPRDENGALLTEVHPLYKDKRLFRPENVRKPSNAATADTQKVKMVRAVTPANVEVWSLAAIQERRAQEKQRVKEQDRHQIFEAVRDGDVRFAKMIIVQKFAKDSFESLEDFSDKINNFLNDGVTSSDLTRHFELKRDGVKQKENEKTEIQFDLVVPINGENTKLKILLRNDSSSSMFADTKITEAEVSLFDVPVAAPQEQTEPKGFFGRLVDKLKGK